MRFWMSARGAASEPVTTSVLPTSAPPAVATSGCSGSNACTCSSLSSTTIAFESRRNASRFSAIVAPTPSSSQSSSTNASLDFAAAASRSFDSRPYFSAIGRAITLPTFAIPSEYSNRANVAAALALAIDSIRFFAEVAANRSSPSSWACVSANRSATSVTRPAAMTCATTFSPSPSMFIAPRDAKNSIAAWSCAGQPRRFGHSSATLPSSRSSACPHDGHTVGGSNTAPGPGSVTARICGMISPAFSISTRSPRRSPSRAT